MHVAKSILIIEDDVSIRELLVELLESEGYKVFSAENGLEALSILNKGTKLNLIIVDLMMPVMDGYAFRKEQLKNDSWSNIPTIVMSAESNAKEKLKSYNVTAFFSKPIELETILQMIKKYAS